MAERSERARPQSEIFAAPPLVGISGAQTESGAAEEHLLIFTLAGGSFGLRLSAVAEILRLPFLARMPLAPPSLLGLANLRGTVLPVLSLRRLLDLPEAPVSEMTRVIVIDGDLCAGFVVDQVDKLVRLRAGLIRTDNAGAGAVDPNLLEGVVQGAEGESTTKILNPCRLLRDHFAEPSVQPTRSLPPSIATGTVTPAAQRRAFFVSFDVAGQEYGLPLERVREIVPLPEHIAEVPRSESAVLGVVTLRDRLLPLVSLYSLLGLASDRRHQQGGKVVVLTLGKGAVGIVVDRMREILRIEESAIDPAPALLTRGEGDAEITSIGRLDGGRRLVALLAPDRLFRSDLARRVLSERSTKDEAAGMTVNDDVEEQFVIFQLGDQEFGLPVGAVDEIARMPERITALPKAPAFIDGIINLRGNVVPIIDLRRRFQLPSPEPRTGHRVLVLTIGSGLTGFVVDRVLEVKRIPAAMISPTPHFSSEQMRLIGRVVNVEARGRMILLVDPAQLLDTVEADVLATFDRSALASIPR